MRTIKESLAALHIQRRHKTDKDDWTKTRCARPSLTGVGHRDLGCILRLADFFFYSETVNIMVLYTSGLRGTL